MTVHDDTEVIIVDDISIEDCECNEYYVVVHKMNVKIYRMGQN